MATNINVALNCGDADCPPVLGLLPAYREGLLQLAGLDGDKDLMRKAATFRLEEGCFQRGE